MEERAVGGKEKKYVLYTVVNDDKARAGFGVWMVRILLGSLLLVALAVVPYVSLRLAQVNDRTLVVFQPVPVHNHSRNHHHKSITRKPGTIGLHSASLVRANLTTELPKAKKGSNATIVTLHESAVTLSLLEDTNNVSHSSKNQSTESGQSEADDVILLDERLMNVTSSPFPAETRTETEDNKETSLEGSEIVKETKQNLSSEQSIHVESPLKDEGVKVDPTSSTTETKKEDPTQAPPEVPEKEKSKLVQILKSSTTTTSKTATATSTSRPITKFPPPTSGIKHKLAYVATAASGNHVGGICVWKTNKNVTKWSYFYDNIPIEYQSPKDNTDHEMRALIAAVRLWADQWHDYHIVLRSQHPSIEKSKHQTRLQFVEELDELSEQHFTYELEWRQRKDDSLMGIAYCLSRLHKDFNYWFNKFEERVDTLLGDQDWRKTKEQNRLFVPQKLFVTNPNPKPEEKLGDLTSLSQY